VSEATYNAVTPEIVSRLEQIVGAGNVVFDDAEALEPFSHDEIPDRHYRSMPEAVVRPGSADEICAIMKLANTERIPVTPRGAGSGLSGGAVPVHRGIVLSIERLNRVLEVDATNMVIVVEPGVVTSEINEHVESMGLFYAGYPMSLETCFIGGNVAENAGGAKAVKYGVTGRYVMGLEVVTPTGELIELGGKLAKDVTGYDLLGLMVGSEGTLGIFTKIILKLLPAPKATADLLCMFEHLDDAIRVVPGIIAESGVIPAAIEFMDRTACQEACRYLNETLPYEKAEAMLLITLDGAHADQVERDYDAVGQVCLDHGAMEVYVADNRTTSERLWRVRRNVAEAFSIKSPYQLGEDLVVPIAGIVDLVRGLAPIAERHGVEVPAFGHAGDGNVHIRITPPADWTEEQWRDEAPKIQNDLYDLAVGLGGHISGEHGIGHKRKGYLPRFLTPATIETMKTIKRAFDPNAILNPGKIFP